MIKQFYAYTYTDPNTNKVIYVGKGCGNRAYKHLSRTHNKTLNGRLKLLRVLSIEPIINIYECPDEEFAFFLEEEMISKYGRIDNGTGSLFNHTDGGEGSSGNIRTDESKRKTSESLKGHGFSQVTLKKMSDVKLGKPNTWSSKFLSGKPNSSSTKFKKGQVSTNKGKQQPIIKCPHCGKSGGNAMTRWHFDKCKYKG